jgi:hypothetical protein
VRRLLLLLLFGLLMVGGAAFIWQAMGQAKQVADDLAATKGLLAQAGGFQTGPLGERLALIDQAEQHARAADARLGRWPLRHLGAVPVATFEAFQVGLENRPLELLRALGGAARGRYVQGAGGEVRGPRRPARVVTAIR